MQKDTPYYLARIHAFFDAANIAVKRQKEFKGNSQAVKDLELWISYYRNGFEPDLTTDKYRIQLQAYDLFSIEERIRDIKPQYENNKNRALSQIELQTYDTWFALHPEKIAGVQEAQSGYSFPVRVKGTQQDIVDAITNGMKGEKPKVELKVNSVNDNEYKPNWKEYPKTSPSNTDYYVVYLGKINEIATLVFVSDTNKWVLPSHLVQDDITHWTEKPVTHKIKFNPISKIPSKGFFLIKIKTKDETWSQVIERSNDTFLDLYVLIDHVVGFVHLKLPQKANKLALIKIKAKAAKAKLLLLQLDNN